MSKAERAILTNMCMVYDNNGKILVQDRKDPNWSGITFPGGHIEKGESFVRSVIREVYEETGLDIKSPKLCGIKQFQNANDVRYVVLLFKTHEFSGRLRSSEEGEVFWIEREDLHKYKMTDDFAQMIKIFENDSLSEFYYEDIGNNKWDLKMF
ncbi:MAG: 8-oxo-dGTP diphosphatase [Clostridiales bacterium]|nr:8-oxo-dGTP diphosphatase [Clostridiales bacterium]